MLMGFPLELGTGTGDQNKLNNGATGPPKKFDDNFSHVDAVHQRDWQTDGHGATAKTVLTYSVAW